MPKDEVKQAPLCDEVTGAEMRPEDADVFVSKDYGQFQQRRCEEPLRMDWSGNDRVLVVPLSAEDTAGARLITTSVRLKGALASVGVVEMNKSKGVSDAQG